METINKASENHTEKVKCIKLDDLITALNSLETKGKEYDKLVKYGLPVTVNKDATIAILNNNGLSKKTIYYEFPRVKNNYLKHNKSEYNIPMFFKHITSGFSLFCTLSEKKFIEKYYSQAFLEEEENNKNEDNDISKSPKPLREHSYCHLCKRVFQDYVNHVNSKLHQDNYVNNKPVYGQIADCFKRVRHFWSKNEEKKIKINTIKLDNISEIETKSFHEICNNNSTQTTNLTQTIEYMNIKGSENDSVFGNELNPIKTFRKRKYETFLKDNPSKRNIIRTLPPIIHVHIIKENP